jgi:arsenate reductase
MSNVFAADKEVPPKMIPEIREYVEKRLQEFDQIADDHKAELKKVARYVKDQVAAGQSVRLTFICTHNSRRSQFSQVWAAAAASHFNVRSVETFSGGTEATAFNPRAVAALERAGLKIDKAQSGTNPRYKIRYLEGATALTCFSKVYHEPPNPDQNYCAVMVCSQADQHCPIVKGCTLRISLPYEDPKVSDGTPEEVATYDERCQQICREMLYLFSQAVH